jgi:glycosyltransferase involved in cell wall biosynthesis
MSAEITVIIPAYNAGLHIGNAITSVIAQNYSKNIEIFVIDDGSTDNTAAVISDISRNHKQIICLANERKKGPSGARNTGLLKASGKYAAFLDADDLWFPNHLMEGVNFLERHNDIDIVLFNFNIIDYKTKRFISDWFTERSFAKDLKSQALEDGFHLICDNMFTALINESFMHLQSMIVRREALRGVLFNEDIKRSEDRDFSIRLYLESNARFAFSEKITGIYYRHEDSLTSDSILNSLHTTLDQIRIYSGYLENLSLDAAAAARLKDLLYHRYLHVSYYYRKINCYRLAAISLYKSFRYRIGLPQFKEFAKIAISFVIFKLKLPTTDKDRTSAS